MATYSYAIQYINKRPHEIKASDCTSGDLNKDFYCPTPGCNAKLILCSVNGTYPPYFKRLPSTPHSSFCTLPTNTINQSKIDTNSFNPVELYNNTVTHTSTSSNSNTNLKSDKKSNTNSTLKLKQLSTIFYYLKSLPINTNVNGTIIKNFLVDTRTSYLYKKVIFGLKLVEAQILYYKNNSITIGYPINNTNLKFNLTFLHNNDFEKILSKCPKDNNNKLIPFSKSKPFIAVYGDWNNFSCTIYSSKQIIFPKYR